MRLPSVQHPSSKSLLQVRERDFNFRFLELTLLLALRSMGLVEFALDLKLDKNKTNLLGFGSFSEVYQCSSDDGSIVVRILLKHKKFYAVNALGSTRSNLHSKCLV